MYKVVMGYIVVLIFIPSAISQQTPAKKQTFPIKISNATIHIGNGEKIEKGTIVFEKGIITYIGSDDNAPKTNNIIDANGNHVYPGFIALNTILGLEEIVAVRATHDFNETGEYNPNVRSISAYNSSSKITPTNRTNGVLLGQITPRGGIVSGTSSVVHYDSWNWQDALVKEDEGIHVNFPIQPFPSPIKALKNITEKYNKKVKNLELFFKRAKSYISSKKTKNINLKFESMRGLFSGQQNLYLHVVYAVDIIKSVEFFKRLKIPKIVLVGAYESYLVTKYIKENNIPVILKRIHSLPMRADEPIDQPFKVAKILLNEGLKVALEAPSSGEPMQGRNLPFYAGTLVGYGVDKEDALKMITSVPAEILGIDQFGTLELGKSATLFVSKGDAFDMQTNQLTHAFIQGREISLDNHQKKLYRKYRKKHIE